MELIIGTEKFSPGQQVVWNPDKTINPHMFFIGESGSGKTYRIKKILSTLQMYPVRIHVFDLHGDLDTNPIYTSEVVFSNTSQKGLNPLKINRHPDYGGVKRRIKTFIDMLERYSVSLGIRQVSVLRALLTDLYNANHIYTDKPDTWKKDKYPTLLDLKRFTHFKLKAMIFGNAEATIKALEGLNKYMRSLDRTLEEKDIDNDARIQRLKSECLSSFKAFVDNIKTGREIDQYLNYDSKDVLKSVYTRIDSLCQMSIFKDIPPGFDPEKSIHKYSIKSIPREEQGYLVEMFLEEIFLKQIQKGISTELETVVVLDEAHRFISEEPDHIINIIIKEGRKFGLSIIFSTQDPAHLNRDIIMNCGTKLILSVDELLRDNIAKKLGVEAKKLKFIQPRKSAVVQIKTLDSNNSKFTDVLLA